ncbi:hypothetical protein GHO43_30740, partial [Pseudomonas sp. FSL R10-0071]|nr:hypothetical protein [Pseudomonas sp. FSL R10-0071]
RRYRPAKPHKSCCVSGSVNCAVMSREVKAG